MVHLAYDQRTVGKKEVTFARQLNKKSMGFDEVFTFLCKQSGLSVYSESLFKTIIAALTWFTGFIDWYNTIHFAGVSVLPSHERQLSHKKKLQLYHIDDSITIRGEMMPSIRPSADLRNKYNVISDFCHKYTEPVFITRNGLGDLAVLSIETYEMLLGKVELYKKIDEGLEDLNKGEKTGAEEVFSTLKKRFGN